MISSNYGEDPDTIDPEEPEYTDPPTLEIVHIQGIEPELGINLDEDGLYYIKDFDTLNLIDTSFSGASYVDLGTDTDDEAGAVYDGGGGNFIWSVGNNSDGWEYKFWVKAVDEGKFASSRGYITVMSREKSTARILPNGFSSSGGVIEEIEILDYNVDYRYSDPIVPIGTAERIEGIIYWTIPSEILDEYRQYIEKDGALERRFQKVLVEPTTIEESIEILNNIKERYEDHHSVDYTDEAIKACVKLTDQTGREACRERSERERERST